MKYIIDTAEDSDGRAVIDIFNHYVKSSFAAYPNECVPYQSFELLRRMAEGYPFLVARDENGSVLGFAMLRPHNPIAAFSGAAEVSCFVAPGQTGMGIGSRLYDGLMLGGREKGLHTILASISSLNPKSLAFHKRQGFVQCGRFLNVGRKWGKDFDEVWMQKMI
jgi:phosphinothricin acetyltransferase